MMSDEHRLSEQPSVEQKRAQERDVHDLDAVLRSPNGRRFLLRLIERCGIYRCAYTGEAEATAFRTGEQNIGLWLIAQIERVGPAEYPRLLIEQASEKPKNEVGNALVDEAD